MICASCDNQIDTGNKSDEGYKMLHGRYCLPCLERINKNCMKRYDDNLEFFNYAFQTNKAVDNMKIWKEKGYLS